jgi:hypothetical protein
MATTGNKKLTRSTTLGPMTNFVVGFMGSNA